MVVNRVSFFLVCVAGLALAGCSKGLLGGSREPLATNAPIPVNNELALPPDLSLRAPSNQTYNAPPTAPAESTALYSDAPPPSKVAALPKGTTTDPYQKYGISKLKPDGTPKDDWELRQELRAAVIAEKRKSNKNYGTVFNAGELFSDN
jgi:hypothetical protein